MYDGQLELSFGSRPNGAGQGGYPPRSLNRHQRRGGRAGWWFQRMRQIVDRATDWEPAPPARPEQAWFANSYRQPGPLATPAASPDQHSAERQMCE
jgi:hypothetical protein